MAHLFGPTSTSHSPSLRGTAKRKRERERERGVQIVTGRGPYRALAAAVERRLITPVVTRRHSRTCAAVAPPTTAPRTNDDEQKHLSQFDGTESVMHKSVRAAERTLVNSTLYTAAVSDDQRSRGLKM